MAMVTMPQEEYHMHTHITAATTSSEVLLNDQRLRRRYRVTILILTGVLFAIATIGMSIGAVSVPFWQVWDIVWHHLRNIPIADELRGTDLIIWEIRAPRVVLGGLVGAGLAASGVAVQAMVRNPLADPYTLGIQSGAAAGAVAVIFFGGALRSGLISPAVGGFIGALVTLLLVFSLARQRGRVSSMRLLLVGISLSYALSGFTTFMQYATHDPAGQSAILFWIIGGLGGAEWSKIPLMAIVLGVAVVFIWYRARQLNVLAIGDESATALGMRPDHLRVQLFVVLSLAIAVAVSMVGPIGFVGLVVPHVARLIVGAEHRRVIPLSLLLGAIYLVGVDVLARWLIAPSEIPVGVLTAILGTPFFVWLIRRRDALAIREGQ